ncbi:uncharacterized protein [Parasteatoda tepidariorum]|uniref:uncharacterized protein n=1 Tax=Parasteatoda tepidariorum TaxID=114398 RepID=UPI00077F8CD8|nr:uncharacterized protein LOC107455641 [Parasteatoda tepidariorum]
MEKLVLLSVLFSLASCNSQCFLEKKDKCESKAWEELLEADLYDYCSTKPKIIKCIKTAATDCRMGFQKESEKLLSAITDVCTEGSKLNKDLKKHEKCLEKAVSESTHCLKPITEIMEKKGDLTPDEIVEVQRIGCLNIDKIKECMFESAKSLCGSEADTFQRTIYEPEADVQKKVCSEVMKVQLEKRANGNTEVRLLSSFLAPFTMM